jgi:ribosome recycling factor
MDAIQQHTIEQMNKSIKHLESGLNKIRTGRAHPSILDGILLEYYGEQVPLSQVANILAEDSHTLAVSPWEKNLIPEIEKAILKSNLGFNPNTQKDIIRLPLPMMTEDTRHQYIKQARAEAENARVAIRNLRRNANENIKKNGDLSEDMQHKATDQIQKVTDEFVSKIDSILSNKESDLMTI